MLLLSMPASMIWKITTEVPSLNRLSLSMITERRLDTPRSRKSATTEIGSVAEMSDPNTSAGNQRKADHPMQRVAGDQRGHQHADDGQQHNRRQILTQMADVDVDARFEEQRREEQDQDDVGSQE